MKSRSIWILLPMAGLIIGLLVGWAAWGLRSAGVDDHQSPVGGSSTAESQGKPNAADIGFSQDMTVHHNQALQMATFALANSRSDEIRRLALQILTSQATEKGLMSGWLILWEAPELPSGPHMAWMNKSDHSEMAHDMASMDAHTLMPGMASIDQMAKLGQLKGRDFDIFFLQLMIRHHAGGIPMAEAAARLAATPAVRGLALEIARAQTQENASMLAQLQTMGGEPLA